MSERDSKEKLTRLKAIRGGHRGVVTKHEKEALGILSSGTLSKDDISRIQLIQCLLEEKQKTLTLIDQDILTLCPVEEITQEIEDSESMVARIMSVKGLIVQKTSEQTVSPGASNSAQVTFPQVTTPQATSSNDVTNTVVTSNEQPSEQMLTAGESNIPSVTSQINTGTHNTESKTVKPKLPKLNLPKFRGDVTSFTTFWEIFESAIDKNEGLAEIDKFHYLHSLLEGPAARAIQGLALTSANYKRSIEVLKQRFGRPQQIIASHMDELLKVPVCSDDKSTSMRLVYDRINTNIRGLESLGINSDQYGSLLIPVIMSKLPSETRLHIARNAVDEVWKIDDLMKTIRSEVEAREVSEHVKTTGDRKPNPLKPKTTSSLYSGDYEDTYRRNQIRCVFCHEIHYSASCEKIKNVKQRKDILRKEGRCFVCLRTGHRGSECQRTCRKCNGKHHQSICFKSTDGKEDQSKKEESKERSKQFVEDKSKEQSKNEQVKHDDEQTRAVKATTTTTSQQRSSVLLQTATAYAYNSVNSKRVMIRILFDSGSQRSYITNELKQKLDLKSEKREILHLNTFGSDGFKKQKSEMFSFNLQGKNGEIDIEISALAFPVICSPVTTTIDVQAYPHLDGLQLADNSNGDNQSIDMLLGADHYYSIITGEVINGDNGPTAVASKLGWLLLGPTSNTSSSHAWSNLVIDGRKETPLEEKENDELVSTLKRFWDLESLGIVESEQVPESDILQDITFTGKRYKVGLPWNNDETSPLSNDYELSFNRLISLINRLKKDPTLFREYNAIIEEQIKEGIVEHVPESEKEIDNAHFIPHHGVIRNDRDTTKLRIVFDGSAKQEKDGSSLNDHLLNGPNFIPPIFDVLVKFRSHAIGLTADIEKAFLQIEIKEADRDKLRFFWIQDPNSSKTEVQQLRFCRLVFGLKPSPSILGGTVLHHLSKYRETEPEIVEVLKDLYVDDLPTGANDDDTAFKIYKKSKEIMKQGGFNLRKWKSSSKELLNKINQCELTSESVNNEGNELNLTKDEARVSQDNQTYVKSMIGPQLPDESKTIYSE